MSNRENKLKVGLAVILFVLAIIIIIVCNRIKDGDQAAPDKVPFAVSKFNKFADASDEDFNYRIAFNKGYSSSDDEMTKEYLALQQKYRNALSKFLMKKLNIGNLNDEMKTLNLLSSEKRTLNDVASTEEYFLSISKIDSDYLYLRNNIKIERLTKDDMKLLTDGGSQNRINQMLERTYQNVLAANHPDIRDKYYNISYRGTGSEFVEHRTIVFYLSYQKEFDKDGNYINRQDAMNKHRVADKVATKYSDIFSKELGKPVRIFLH